MNTKTILSILFIITLFSAKAQINAGLGGTFSYPIKDFNGLTNYSLAGEIGLGYTFKQQIDVDIAYSHYLVNSNISNKHKIYAYSTNIKYYFTKTNIRPYINLGFGKYYMEYVDVFGFDIKKFDDFGINPGVGILFKLNFFDGLFTNASISYLQAMKEPQVEMINFNIGLVYYL